MCTSIVQVVFNIFLSVGFVVTVVAFCTPGWSRVYWNNNGTESATEAAKHGDYSFGLITNICGEDKNCIDSFKKKPSWEKAVIICMILAILSQIIAFIWSCIVCCACCCKSCLAPPLPILTALSALFILIAVIIYLVKMGDLTELKVPSKIHNSNGYSLWLAVAAFVIMVFDTILGCILCKTATVSPL